MSAAFEQTRKNTIVIFTLVFLMVSALAVAGFYAEQSQGIGGGRTLLMKSPSELGATNRLVSESGNETRSISDLGLQD